MKKIVFFCFAVTFVCTAYAQNFIVSFQEMNASNAAKEEFTPKLVPQKDAPVIELLSPNLVEAVSSPTTIQIKFTPTAPAQVDPKSFKALYGTFQINITDRLLAYAEVTDGGINVKSAKLPSGAHKMLLQITDSSGRVGFRVIEFTVK